MFIGFFIFYLDMQLSSCHFQELVQKHHEYFYYTADQLNVHRVHLEVFNEPEIFINIIHHMMSVHTGVSKEKVS